MKVTGIIFAASLVLLPTAKASITFNATYDSSLTAADQLAIGNALAVISASISSPNNVTDNLFFSSMSSGLGESITSEYNISYDAYYNALLAVATTPTQLAAIASLGTAPTSSSSPNPVDGSTQVTVTSTEGRNLGFSTAGGVLGTYDSEILLNTSITSPPASPSGSNYSLESVAMHEIDESLGIGGTGSTLTGSGGLTGPVGDLDLFRYSAPGVRSYSNNAANQPYLSFDGGNTVVSYFNQVAGADFADWQSDPDAAGFPVQVQDAFATPGTNPTLGPNELTAFGLVGYQMTSTPEPGTLGMFGASIVTLAFLLRRYSRK